MKTLVLLTLLLFAACGDADPKSGDTVNNGAANNGAANNGAANNGATNNGPTNNGGQAGTVDASTWNKSCVEDTECGVVFEGNVCECRCGGTAVNAGELAKYDAVVAETVCEGVMDACRCATFDQTWCNAGTCELGQRPDPVDPVCAAMDSNGFFSTCDACGADCDTISTPSGSAKACGCSDGCPCGLSCGSFEIAPNVSVSGICVR